MIKVDPYITDRVVIAQCW